MLRILQVVGFCKLTLSEFARIRPLLHPFGERQDLITYTLSASELSCKDSTAATVHLVFGNSKLRIFVLPKPFLHRTVHVSRHYIRRQPCCTQVRQYLRTLSMDAYRYCPGEITALYSELSLTAGSGR